MKTENHLVIRQAQATEVDKVTEAANDAYALYLDRMEKKPGPMRTDYNTVIERKQLDIVEIAGEFAGMIQHKTVGAFLEVANVAILPDFRRQGLGKLLMMYAQHLAITKGLNGIRLFTNVAMSENIPFYETLGYVEVDRRIEVGYERIFFEKVL